MSNIKLSNSYRGFLTNIFGHRQKIFVEGLEFYNNKFWVQYRIHNNLKLYKKKIDVLLDMYPKSMFYDHDYIKLMRYVALKVQNIMEAFDFLKTQRGVTMINTSADYQPFKIDETSTDDFYFFDSTLERDGDENKLFVTSFHRSVISILSTNMASSGS